MINLITNTYIYYSIKLIVFNCLLVYYYTCKKLIKQYLYYNYTYLKIG